MKSRKTIVWSWLAIACAALLMATPASASRCTSLEGSKTLVVGDSHTWLSGCGSAYPRWDVDARPGRAAVEAEEVVGELLRPRHKRLVFDIATNNHGRPQEVRPALRRIWQQGMVGSDRTMVLVTAWALAPSMQPGLTTVNGELRDFRRAHPQRVKLVEWAATAQREPGLFSGDKVHFTGAGYDRRVQMVSAATKNQARRIRRAR